MGDAFFGAALGQLQRWRAGQAGGGAASQSSAIRVQLAAVEPLSVAQAEPGSTWPPRSLRRWSAWAAGFGLGGHNDGDGSVGSARLGYSMGGGAVGADVEVTHDLLIGGALGAAASDFTLDGRSASGTAATIYFGAYGSWTRGPLYVDAALGYGHGHFTTSRGVTLGALNERASGAFEGDQYGGRLEAGWRFTAQRVTLTPFANLAVQALHQDGYTESSADMTGAPGILGLSYQGQTTTSVRSFLGGEASTTVRLGDRVQLSPRLRLAWAHEFNRDRQVNASFLTLPGAAFTVSGARPAANAAIVSAGVDVAVGRNAALFAQFDGDIASGSGAYAGTGGLRVSW
jgi:outer membrane autotransporter protein